MELDDLSRLIINHRNKRNLTQKQLASEMGVTQVAVAHWESGKSKPSAESYQKLNLLLHLDTPDIDISDLLASEPISKLHKIVSCRLI